MPSNSRFTPIPPTRQKESTGDSVSRRQLLLAAAGCAGAVSFSAELNRVRAADEPFGSEVKGTAPNDPGDIDAHVHVWASDTDRYPLAAGYRREEMRPAGFTPDELDRHALPAGVRRVVLVQMSFYGFDNRYMLDTIAAGKGRYAGIAVVDDESPEVATEMRRLLPLGVRGFRVYPRNRPIDRWLDGASMQAMWRTAAETRQSICCLVNPSELPAIDRMCAANRDTPVVIDHLARLGMAGAMREEDLAALCALARHPRVYVKVSAFYALGQKRPPYTDLSPTIRRVAEAFGAGRLMWGSDCPFQVVEQSYVDSIELVRSRLEFLSTNDRRELLRGTAERLFF